MTKILPSVCSEQLVNKDESQVLEHKNSYCWIAEMMVPRLHGCKNAPLTLTLKFEEVRNDGQIL